MPRLLAGLITCAEHVQLRMLSAQGHCRLAAALRAKGQADAAVAAYKRALELDLSCESAVLALQKLVQ